MAWAPRGGFGDRSGEGSAFRDSEPRGGGFRDGGRDGGGGFNDRGSGFKGGGGSGFNKPKEEQHVYGKTTELPPPPEGWPRNVEWNLKAYLDLKAGTMSLTGVRNRSRKRDVKKK